ARRARDGRPRVGCVPGGRGLISPRAPRRGSLRPMRVRPLLSRVGLVAILLAAAASADVLVLKDGRRIEGTIVSEAPDKVRIKTGLGEVDYARADVLSIEHGKTPRQELAEREAAAKTGEDFYQAALFAEKKVSKSETKRLML